MELLTDIDILLWTEKRIRDVVCHKILRHLKAHNKYMIKFYKAKDSSYINFVDKNNLYDEEMCEKLLVDGFE